MNILISLDKQYLDQIKLGVKKYEYRRKFVNQPCRIYLYITDPVKKIMAYMDCAAPVVDTPQKISELAEKQISGIGGEIYQYMSGLEKGYAIPILKLVEIEPVDIAFLKEKFGSFAAPQSYIILENKPELLKYLESRQEYASSH